ncbi:helix-turn-helix transcriptional regulator [Pseudokineococcus sp. 1T1Z-3]|uniref:helix-turn-helix transcriptional regulator n=1 Tax=Pseudokineococcus sp. 1T1Z-3 TaxID=3132745 RepID=UPI00403F0FCE
MICASWRHEISCCRSWAAGFSAVARPAPLTQWRLAEVSGVSRPTIARAEAGAVVPHLSTIKALARSLDVRPQELTQDLEALWSPAATDNARD